MKEITYPFENVSLLDIEGEHWKDIKGFEGYYQISNLGRVKSLHRVSASRDRHFSKKEGLILKQHVNTSQKTRIRNIVNKQLSVTLCIEGKAVRMSMSRLMYTTFVHPLSRKQLVCHYDEDNLNNKPENLYIVTFKKLGKRNIQTGKTKAPISNPQSIRKAHNIPVSKFGRDGKYICSYESITDAAAKENIAQSSITRVCSGKRKQAGGYIWRKGIEQKRLPREDFATLRDPLPTKVVLQYDLEGNFIQRFNSLSDAMRALGIPISTLSCACRSRTGFSNGYLWCFEQLKDKNEII